VWRSFAANASCTPPTFLRGESGYEKARGRDSWKYRAEPRPHTIGDSLVELRLQNGRSLMVGRGFDAEHVRALLALAEAAG